MKLQQNMGPIDRALRVTVGVLLATAIVAGLVAAPWGYVAGALSAIMLLTGATGFCPLYAVFRISTRHRRA